MDSRLQRVHLHVNVAAHHWSDWRLLAAWRKDGLKGMGNNFLRCDGFTTRLHILWCSSDLKVELNSFSADYVLAFVTYF